MRLAKNGPFFMSFYVYILESSKTGKYYCGQCNNVDKRLRRHNAGEMKSTKAGCPWKLIGYIECESRSPAVRLERKIKARGIGRWLQENKHLLVQPG